MNVGMLKDERIKASFSKKYKVWVKRKRSFFVVMVGLGQD